MNANFLELLRMNSIISFEYLGNRYVDLWQKKILFLDTQGLSKNSKGRQIHLFLRQYFSFYENKVLQLMSAGVSLEKVWWKDLAFIKWRLCKQCFKNEQTLVKKCFNLFPRVQYVIWEKSTWKCEFVCWRWSIFVLSVYKNCLN